MTKNVRLLLTVLALVGLASAIASLYVHYQLLTRPGYLSFCDVNATVSCSQVYQSQYAYLAGAPVALLGARTWPCSWSSPDRGGDGRA